MSPLLLLALSLAMRALAAEPAPAAVVSACVQASQPDCEALGRWWQPLPDGTPEASWQIGCATGDGTACFRLAERYVEIDPGGHEALWLALYELACRREHPQGCETLLSITGTAPLVWLAARVRAAADRCATGDDAGCLDVAIVLDAGTRTLALRDVPDAERRVWMGAQCDQGLPWACYDAGLQSAHADLTDEALDRLDMACRLGVADACRSLRRVRRGKAP